MRTHILDGLFLPHGIFNNVTGRWQVGCTPPCLVIEHIFGNFTVQIEKCGWCLQVGELADQKGS